jgi:fatty acid desaturase
VPKEAPVAPANHPLLRWFAPTLNDPRDVVFIETALWISVIQVPFAVGLLVVGDFSWWWALLYWALWGYCFLDKYILMLHCVCHRPLFNRRFRFLNLYIPWVLGPFCGETPDTYFVHHMGMHHKEGNLHGDLSSTMRFQRDSFWHWLRYYSRFMFLGLAELTLYQWKRGRQKLARRVVIGELSFVALVLLLGTFVSWQATLVVFVIPVLVVRILMMAGNWGQHAFVDPQAPSNDFKSSITCINTRYNRRCFNDGYHIIHHLKPALHYSEMDVEFEEHRALYGEQDAIVFEGVDFFMVWLLLMTKQHHKLARAFVRLPGAPERSEAEVLTFLRGRLVPIPR